MLSNKADKIVVQRYPNAEIFRLEREKKLTKGQLLTDLAADAFTDLVDPIATFDFIKNIKKQFYLVNDADEILIVMVEKDNVQAEKIDEDIVDNKFEYNGYIYRNKGQLEK